MAESIIPDTWEAERWRYHVRAASRLKLAYEMLRLAADDLDTLARNREQPWPAYAAPMADARSALTALTDARTRLDEVEYAPDADARR